MNTTKPNDITKVREVSDAELAGIAGGFYSMQFWRQVGYMTAAAEEKPKAYADYAGATPSQKESAPRT